MTWRLRPPIARRSRLPPAGPDRPAKLWRDRRFAVFLTAQTLSVAGDSFALIAVPLLVLRATGSVDGDISTPRFVMADGATIKGRVDVSGKKAV